MKAYTIANTNLGWKRLLFKLYKDSFRIEFPNVSSDKDCRGSQKIFDKFKQCEFIMDTHNRPIQQTNALSVTWPTVGQ